MQRYRLSLHFFDDRHDVGGVDDGIAVDIGFHVTVRHFLDDRHDVGTVDDAVTVDI